MTLDDALEAFRARLANYTTYWAHHWSDEETDSYGFRMSLGANDVILLELPNGTTARLGITVTVVEVL